MRLPFCTVRLIVARNRRSNTVHLVGLRPIRLSSIPLQAYVVGKQRVGGEQSGRSVLLDRERKAWYNAPVRPTGIVANAEEEERACLTVPVPPWFLAVQGCLSLDFRLLGSISDLF